ncbi:MAG: hypothetical protein WD208_10800 [Dehalococcoidia bacterium]
MTLINIENNSTKPVMVPARGGFSVVLAPGERSTVCPEGMQGQGEFWKMMSRGVIAEKDRVRIRRVQFVPSASSHGDFNEAA